MSGRVRAAWDALRGRGVRREDFERLHGAYLTVIDQRDRALAAKAEVTMLSGQRDENSQRAAELAAELTAAREEVAHWRKRMEAHDTQAFEAVASASEMADKVEELTGLLREALPAVDAAESVIAEDQGLRGRIRAVLGVPLSPDGWIQWNGGGIRKGDYESRPPGLTADTQVQVEMDGWRHDGFSGAAGSFRWWHDGTADIARYRIVNAAHTDGRNSPSANSEGGAA